MNSPSAGFAVRLATAARGQLLVQVREAFGRGGERLIALRKCEPQHPMAELVAMVEAGSRNRGYADRVEKKVGGLEVVTKPKLADVGHDVVGALRHPASQPRALERSEQDRALALIHRFQFGVKRLGHR